MADMQQAFNAMRNAGLLRQGEGREFVQNLVSIEDVTPDLIVRAVGEAPSVPPAKEWLDARLAMTRESMAGPAPQSDDPFGDPLQGGGDIDNFMGNEQTPQTGAAQYATQGRQAPSNSRQHQARPNQRGQGGGLKSSVYGRTAMVLFASGENTAGEPTVSLYALPAIGPRNYDRDKKLQIQLTRAELPIVANVFLGNIPRCDYSAHGPQHDKGFSFERKADVIMANVRARGRSLTVPIEASDAYYVGMLILSQLALHYPGLDTIAMNLMLKAAASIYKVPAPRNQSAPRQAAGSQ